MQALSHRSTTAGQGVQLAIGAVGAAAQLGARLQEGYQATQNPSDRSVLQAAVVEGRGSTADIFQFMAGRENPPSSGPSGATKRAVVAARQRRSAGSRRGTSYAKTRVTRVDCYLTNTKIVKIVQDKWIEHATPSPLVRHAGCTEPTRRRSAKAAAAEQAGEEHDYGQGRAAPEIRDKMYTTFGSAWITQKLHEDTVAMVALEQLGVKPRKKEQVHPLCNQLVAAMRPWWVIPLDIDQLDACACRPCTEPRELWTPLQRTGWLLTTWSSSVLTLLPPHTQRLCNNCDFCDLPPARPSVSAVQSSCSNRTIASP